MPEFPPRVPDAHDKTAHLRIDSLERSFAELRAEFGDIRKTINELNKSMSIVTNNVSWIRTGMEYQSEELALIKRNLSEHHGDFYKYKNSAVGSGNVGKALGVIATLVALLAAALGFNLV